VESNVAIGFHMNRGQAHLAIGDFGQAGDFVIQTIVGAEVRAEQQQDGHRRCGPSPFTH
jgi:hypothetical protein